MKKPQPKGWPRLDLYLLNVGGSRRRGRNAVNLWAAATLCRAQLIARTAAERP